jgi:3-hydroxyacyl-CoA dehydrogenase/enoyl-CoA hydratase/3-hydroxybutyryl-CoA epimerase
VAAKFGVSSETFELYPAFSAIIDSVLKGAREPLAQATTTEMNEFLRLMFSPVAGRMVRTLFLGRVRAERELAAPDNFKIVHLQMGPLSDAQKAWSDALAKLKIDKTPAPELPTDHIELMDSQGHAHRIHLQSMSDTTRTAGDDIAAVLAPSGPYGRVMEIVGPAGTPAAHAAAALAARMWALPWPSHGTRSVLQALQAQPLLAQVEQALLWAAEPGRGDISFVDVAACLAGVSPGWTGGPLSWFWDEQSTQAKALGANAQSAWHAVQERLAEACE